MVIDNVESPLPRLTANTIVTKAGLLADLAQVKLAKSLAPSLKAACAKIAEAVPRG